jgi:hypothetical protein
MVEKGCSYGGGRERRHGAQLMAIFGWPSLKEAERYTRGAERKKLAERGMGLLVPLKPGTQSV